MPIVSGWTYMLYDSFYMMYPEQQIHRETKQIRGYQGTGGGGRSGEALSNGDGAFYGVMKSFESRESWWLHGIVNALNTTELHALKWFMVGYANFTSEELITTKS